MPPKIGAEQFRRNGGREKVSANAIEKHRLQAMLKLVVRSIRRPAIVRIEVILPTFAGRKRS